MNPTLQPCLLAPDSLSTSPSEACSTSTEAMPNAVSAAPTQPMKTVSAVGGPNASTDTMASTPANMTSAENQWRRHKLPLAIAEVLLMGVIVVLSVQNLTMVNTSVPQLVIAMVVLCQLSIAWSLLLLMFA